MSLFINCHFLPASVLSPIPYNLCAPSLHARPITFSCSVLFLPSLILSTVAKLVTRSACMVPSLFPIHAIPALYTLSSSILSVLFFYLFQPFLYQYSAHRCSSPVSGPFTSLSLPAYVNNSYGLIINFFQICFSFLSFHFSLSLSSPFIFSLLFFFHFYFLREAVVCP